MQFYTEFRDVLIHDDTTLHVLCHVRSHSEFDSPTVDEQKGMQGIYF